MPTVAIRRERGLRRRRRNYTSAYDSEEHFATPRDEPASRRPGGKLAGCFGYESAHLNPLTLNDLRLARRGRTQARCHGGPIEELLQVLEAVYDRLLKDHPLSVDEQRLRR
jgi:hypothetical protein